MEADNVRLASQDKERAVWSSTEKNEGFQRVRVSREVTGVFSEFVESSR